MFYVFLYISSRTRAAFPSKNYQLHFFSLFSTLSGSHWAHTLNTVLQSFVSLRLDFIPLSSSRSFLSCQCYSSVNWYSSNGSDSLRFFHFLTKVSCLVFLSVTHFFFMILLDFIYAWAKLYFHLTIQLFHMLNFTTSITVNSIASLATHQTMSQVCIFSMVIILVSDNPDDLAWSLA